MLWAPDTCECQFEVAEDWLSARPVSVCKHHSAAKDAFVAVRNENSFKNMVCSFVQEQHADYVGTFSFDTGSLSVPVPDLSADQKAALQTTLDDHFGKGVTVT